MFNSVSKFNFDAAAGTWSVAPDNNYALNPSYEADRIVQTSVAGWTTTGTATRTAARPPGGRLRCRSWDEWT